MKGFTLIELLAVITLLALVTLISTISVANMLKETKNELSKSQIKSIEKATSAWTADNITKLPEGNKCSFLLLKDLKENGLLDSNIVDPDDKKTLSNDIKIKITSKLNNKGKSVLSYEVSAANVSNCTYIGSDVYVDLPKGLTPVIYDGDNWKVPELNEEWYNYDEQKWANAVVLGKGKNKKPGEVVTVDGNNPDALMMLVYIPRYEYKIEGQYGKHPDGTAGTEETPGEIKVNFINNNQTVADDDYILHPAFDFGGEQLHGIWVGKFEISHTTLSSSTTSDNLGCSGNTNCTNAEGLRVLPNKPILRKNNVSNFWYAIKSIENTSLFGIVDVDAHMIKNSEWGAVAYLSQSKYGKYGNNNYTGVYKEIYQNKSEDYITGLSNGTPSQSTSYTQCTYDQAKGTDTNQDQKNCGPGASTTGNIYGVYDMSGGSWEITMGTYGKSNDIIYVGYNDLVNTGFNGWLYNHDTDELIEKTDGSVMPSSKYYNLYNAIGQFCDSCYYGDGLSETKKWYSDEFTISSEIWFIRGGRYENYSQSGIFATSEIMGQQSSLTSTRIILSSK